MDLAAAAAANSSSAWAQPGTLGFLVVFGMGVILYFVFRSLAKHLRKINEAARAEAAQADGALGGGALGGGGLADPARSDSVRSAAGQDPVRPAPFGQ
jgi:hypothetical protein